MLMYREYYSAVIEELLKWPKWKFNMSSCEEFTYILKEKIIENDDLKDINDQLDELIVKIKGDS